MATNDKRRTDVRRQNLDNPFWLTSAEFGVEDTGDTVILFEFPEAGKIFIIEKAVCEVTTLFAGGTPLIDVGFGTVATPGATSISAVGADDLIDQLDITATTAGVYGWTATNSVGAATWATGAAVANENMVVGAATTVPIIYATVSASLTAGVARVHLLVSILPGTRA